MEKTSGYMQCSCRDCFELIVGSPGDICDGCAEAGCEAFEGEGKTGDQECQNPESYGGADDGERM
jgi:hypothetical protein